MIQEHVPQTGPVSGDHAGVAARCRAAMRASYGAAYFTSLLSALLAGGLTYAYVSTIAREANPVTAALIGAAGLEAMLVVKTAAIVGGYWGYFWLGRTLGRPALATGFAWLGALVNVADGAHDVRVALRAGYPVGFEAWPLLGVLLVAALVVGVLARPPSRC